MLRFEFATAGRVIFGAGALHEAGPMARTFGKRALVVTGRNSNRAQPLLSLLNNEGIGHFLFALAGEPTVDAVSAGVKRAREEHCDMVIGFGGGSAIDGAK